mmetsp:Transcript_28697/g.53910  ORF Transcript_28697/g.53910 Transcript_28697/m.53910 type:complete len:101 (+) Transcript_28697:104-406(+)
MNSKIHLPSSNRPSWDLPCDLAKASKCFVFYFRDIRFQLGDTDATLRFCRWTCSNCSSSLKKELAETPQGECILILWDTYVFKENSISNYHDASLENDAR